MTNPAAYINFIRLNEPINTLTTKFGGNPVWLEEASWPISKSTGNPMRFICQISIDKEIYPNSQGKMAYIFMTDEDECVDETWDPESGENAVIIQPYGTSNIKTAKIEVGPTLDSEYNVELKRRDDITFQELEDADPNGSNYDQLHDSIAANKIGGTPLFIQGNEFPDGDNWTLLLQLDSTQVPFDINFGDSGTAYAFINSKGDRGKFLWQCF